MSATRLKKVFSAIALVCSMTAPHLAGASSIDTVVVAQGVYPVSFDPHRDVGIPSLNVNANIYDTLLIRDERMQIAPALAESFEHIDANTLELKLRPNITFHNGEAFNAEDAKFSLDRVLSEEEPSPQRGWINTISSVEVIDERTLRIQTSTPDPVLPARLTLIFMVPKDYVEEVGSKGLAAKPVGTGPYKVGEWVRGDFVDLEAFEDYWSGAAAIKHARFRAIPDTAARIAALQSKDVHLITNLPPDFVPAIERAPDLEVGKAESARVLYIGLVNTRPGPLQDKKVRQAINYAVNTEAIIQSLLLGNGIQVGDVNGHLLRLLGHEFESQLYPYDPDKARQLLAEAGYPDGFSIDLDTPSGRYLMDRDISQVVAAQLADVGIKANVKVHEWGAYSQLFTTHRTSPMYMLGWALPSLDFDHWATPLLGAEEAISNYQNPEVQALITKAKQELDAEKRIELYRELNALVHDDAPWLFLHQQIDLYGVNKALNFTPRSDEAVRLVEITLR